MSGSVLFSTLDITSAYNQIPVRKEDIQKTAFTTKFGLFEYTTMPFGLSNAPATFQRVMEVALRGLQWTICLIYLDDVIIFGRNLEEHINRLREVLSRIKAAGLKLSPRKCFLLQKEVKFLGHVVSEAGVLPNPDNVQKLVEWSQPKTVTDVRAILGLGSYYRRFVKDFSKLVHPLIQLTRKDTSFIWTDDCEEAFQKLKVALVGPDVMGYPRQDCSFILDTDACDVSIGAVLSQFQDGRERVIAYASRVLNKTQRNYCVTDRELLAVVHFTTHFRHYLMGTEFTVRTDHQALKWLFSLREPRNPKCNGKVERFNKTLVRMIRAYLKGEQREWDRNLGCLAAAYRATPHEAIGLTPNLLMLGREARLPAEVMFGSTCQEGEIASYGEYVDGLKKKMQHAHDVARNNLQKSAVKQSEHYDGKPF